jgi:hypothetical protein
VLRALIRSPLTTDLVAPSIARRYARSRSFEAARAGYELLALVPPGAWTGEMISQVQRAPSENDQVEHGNLADGSRRSIPQAVAQLLRAVAPDPEPAFSAGEDDIPF